MKKDSLTTYLCLSDLSCFIFALNTNCHKQYYSFAHCICGIIMHIEHIKIASPSKETPKAFSFRCLENILSLVSKYMSASNWLAFVVAQASSCLTWL